MSWNAKYAFLIATSTAITYATGIFIEQSKEKKRLFSKKVWVVSSLVSNLAILVLFKYNNFFVININRIISLVGIEIIDYRFDFLLPVGISFYTFQALGYTLDVYYGKIKAEKNPLKYALFVSFFPQLVAGPIERSKNLLTQIQKIEKIQVWNFERVKNGFLLMLWGLFQKLVIADRAALLVNTVINNYSKYGFVEICLATILFAFQIYCDFSGYTNMARGAAKIMGFSLMDNFKQPYLSSSIKDFWHRWHISLTSWFTDYLYIPLGGNRKGLVRKYVNVIIVFGISGLWHGASWNFVTWGLMHACYQIIGDIKRICLKRFQVKTKKQTLSTKIRKALVTFALVDFAWIFFVSNSFRHAIAVIKQMTLQLMGESIFNLGLDKMNFIVLLAALSILLAVDILHEMKIPILKVIDRQEIWLRWTIYLGIIWGIIMFGIYGTTYDTTAFIYFQF